MYADYKFYVETYCGTLIPDEVEFRKAERSAEAKLDHYTFGRIDQADDKIRLAVCEMADIVYQYQKRKAQHDGREVSSENNDGYSVSFSVISEQERRAVVDKELYDTAYTYLSRTGLMDWGDQP